MCEDIAKIISAGLIILLIVLAIIFSNSKLVFAAEITPTEALVKIADQPSVFAILGGKKHLIPNAEIFSSYGYKWEDIKIISLKELNSYPDVRLVKTSDNPEVYFLDLTKNLKKAHPSPEVFLAYGNKWEDIRIINEKDLAFYKDAKLVKTKNTPAVYVLEGNNRRLIPSSYVFESLGYKWEEIIEISNIDLNSYALASAVTEPKIKSSSNTPDSSSQSYKVSMEKSKQESASLNVALSKNSPKEGFVATGAKAEFIKIDLSSSKGDVLINGITFTASGIIKDQDVQEVYLSIDKDGIPTKSFLINKQVEFDFQEPVIISQGETKTFNLKATLCNNTDAQYRTIGFGINAPGDIKTEASITGKFPIKENLKQMRSGNDVLGRVEAKIISLNHARLEVNKGAKNQTIAGFNIAETSGNEDILITKLSFCAQGNISYTDLINIDLVDEARRKILQTATWMQKNRCIIYDLETPLKIKKNHSNDFTLRADIVGVEDRSFKFIIDDISAEGSMTGMELIPAINNASPSSNELEIQKDTILIYLDDSSPKEVIAGTENALLASFSIKALNSDLTLKGADLTINYVGSPLEGNITIINKATGEEIFSKEARGISNNQAINMHLAPQTIKQGTVLKFEIHGDIAKNLADETTYLINLCCLEFEGKIKELYNVTPSTIHSNLIYAKSSSLFITPNAMKGSYIAGSKKAMIGSFKLQANYAEDLYVKAINISSQEGYIPLNETTGFYNIKINSKGISYDSLLIPFEYEFKRPLKIKAGSSINIEVYADTYSSVSGKTIALAVSGIDAYGAISNAKPKIQGAWTNGNAVEFVSAGFELAQNEAFTNTLVRCGKQVKIGSFKISTTAEDVKITELTLSTTGASDILAYQNSYSNLKLVNGKKILAKTASPLPEFNVFKTSFTIKKGQTMVIDIYADIPQCCDCKDKYLEISVGSVKAYGKTSKITTTNDSSIIAGQVTVECDCQK